MTSTDVHKLASDIQAKINTFSDMMSKHTKVENKQGEKYVFSASNKGKEKRRKNHTCTIRNHKRKTPKNFKHRKTRKQHIKNLSDIKLTTDQINLLSRGLKFIPMPAMKENHIRRQLILDFNQFARRMCLQYVYHDKETEPHPFHVKSSWIPPIQPLVALESYLENI